MENSTLVPCVPLASAFYKRVLSVVLTSFGVSPPLIFTQTTDVCSSSILTDIMSLSPLYLINNYTYIGEEVYHCVFPMADFESVGTIFSSISGFPLYKCKSIVLLKYDRLELEDDPLLRVIFAKKPIVRRVVILMGYYLNTSGLFLPSYHSYGLNNLGPSFEFYGRNNLTEMKMFLRSHRMNFNKQVMTISIFEKRFFAELNELGIYEGLDGVMCQIIEQALNTTINFVVKSIDERYGHQLQNGSFDGALGDVVTGGADMAGNQVFVKHYGSNNITYSSVVYTDRLCIVVPPSSPLPQWKMVFRCFDLWVWLCIVFAYMFSVIGLYIFTLVLKKKSDLSEIAFIIYALFVRMPIVLPQRSFERFFITTVVVSSFVVTCCFEGSLLTLLTVKDHEVKIDTLDDLDKAGYPIFTLSKNLLNDTFDTSSRLKGLVKKMKYFRFNLSADTVDLVRRFGNVSCVGRESDLRLRLAEGGSVAENPHIVDECPRNYLLAYIVNRYSPFSFPIKLVTSRIQAAGLNLSPKAKLKLNSVENQSEIGLPISLDLGHLTIAFFILMGGYVIGLAVFCVEIVVFKCYARRQAEDFGERRLRGVANPTFSYPAFMK